MDLVDQELFLEMLLKLDGSHESIKAASKWCRANAQYHQDVVRMWFFAVAKARTMIRRLDLFHLASDILFTAETQSVSYFSSFLPQLVKAIPLVRGEDIKLSMRKLFALWREKNIYNAAVMDRLGKLLRNRNKVVDMNVFRYDREMLFKNLNRIHDLGPACDYLMKSMEHSPSFDDSPRLLSTIKERRACNSLLSVVDNHKTKVTTLVSYLEEMVHLLKMSTAALDIAANKEQNGIEETKLKIMAYGRYNEKVLSLLHRLESNYNISKKDVVVPLTPSSPDPEENTLFSRRDVSLLDSKASPMIPMSTVSTWSPQSPAFGGLSQPGIFHRRESYGGINSTGDNPSGFDTSLSSSLGSRTPTRDPYSNRSIPALDQYSPNLTNLTLTDAFPAALGPGQARDVFTTAQGSRTQTRDTFPNSHMPRTPKRDTFPAAQGSRTQTRENFPAAQESRTPTRDTFPTTHRSMTPIRDTFPTAQGSRTPTRDESWYPASPSYSGTSSWGQTPSYTNQTGPVYQKWYTGINQTTDSASPRPPSNSAIPPLLSIPFTTFMRPSASGYTNRKQ